jgi:hypothetical protein
LKTVLSLYTLEYGNRSWRFEKKIEKEHVGKKEEAE